jgi:CRISPR-associated protein Cst2
MKSMSKNVVGFVLIDAPHSALNNDQADPAAADENELPTKVIKRGRESIPYVSAQAWRYWWRNTLENKFDWKMSPIIREKKIAFTSANPFSYSDDDVFGYMRAVKREEGGTLTRLSPLKTSPLISVFPQQVTSDFGVMSRHQGDPVPHVHQFYSTVLKGIFSLDISSVGIFQGIARTGYKNLDEAYTAKPEIKESIEKIQAEQQNGNWILPKNERVKRAKETIKALPFLSGGAKSALHLTDVTPKFIVLAVINGGNHLFMNITAELVGEPLIKTSALKQVITDYKDSILSDVYIGRQEGFHDELQSSLEQLKTDLAGTKNIKLLSAKQAIEEFAESLDSFIE